MNSTILTKDGMLFDVCKGDIKVNLPFYDEFILLSSI